MIAGLTKRSAAHHFGPGRDAPHYVYRCYDADGVLLYVGCTRNPTSRLAAHRRGNNQAKASRWLAATMHHAEVSEPYRGREAGREAERAAIQAESPIFNYQHTADATRAAWMSTASAAEYLILHGHLDLALETACSCWRETREAGGTDAWCLPHAALEARAGA